MLGGTLTATFLALSDARPDLATLSAVGASPRTRRGVAAAYAVVVGLVGALLGVVVGFIPGIAVSYPLTVVDGSYCVVEGSGACSVSGVQTGPFLDVPWLLILGVVVVLPLLTALIVGSPSAPGCPWWPASTERDSPRRLGCLFGRRATQTSRTIRASPQQKVRLDCLLGCRHPDGVTTSRRGRPRACRRRSAPGRCGRGCWTRPWTAWSSAASAVRRPRWSRSGPGVSRGAQLHHFPTKNDLVVAAVEHLTEVRGGRARGRRRAAADRAAADPRGARMLGDHFTVTGLHRRARAVGRRPHRRDPARGGRAARAAGRPRDAPADRRAARRRRVPARRARAGAGAPSTWSAASAWPTPSPTTPAAGPDPRPLGRHARRPP